MNELDANAEEIKQELNDLRDSSDGEQMYGAHSNADRHSAQEDGENIEDNIDNIRVGGKRTRQDNTLEK